MGAFALTPAQLRAVTERDGAILVSAGAGSGKTRVLVERLMRWVEDGQDLDAFLVITYTKAAAAELRGRIAAALSDRLAQQPAHKHFRRQLTRLPNCDICTVHAFCKRVLDEYGAGTGMRGTRLLDEAERSLILTRVLEELLEVRYEEMDERAPFAALVTATVDAKGDKLLSELVLTAFEKTRSHPDPDGWMHEQMRAFAQADGQPVEETVWGRLVMRTALRMVNFGLERLWDTYERLLDDSVLSAAYGQAFMADITQAERLRDALEERWDAAYEAARALTHMALKPVRGYEDRQFQEQCKRARADWKARAEKLRTLLGGTAQEHADDLAVLAPVVHGLFETVSLFAQAFDEEKRHLGVVDFGDLERGTLNLLTADNGRSTVAESLAKRYTEIMVDEYQDISRVQECIVQAVSREGRNVFMVGDVRQSIYRFRLAEPALFLEKYNTFPDEGAPGAPRRVLLEDNFRSRPEVLSAVNALFSDIMSPAVGEMDYTEREYLKASGVFAAGSSYDCELLLVENAPDADDDEESLSKVEAEAFSVAARLRAMLDAGFSVSGDGGARPMRPRDVAVILRAPSLRAAVFEQAFRQVGISCKADGGEDFFMTPEVMTALSLLRVIDNPRQDVALLAALRCPSFDYDAERLAALRAGCPLGDLYDALSADALSEPFLSRLRQWRALAPDLSVFELMEQVYADTGIVALYGAQTDGHVRQHNLMRLQELAQRFEGGRFRGVFSFLQWVDHLQQKGENVARIQPSDDAVSILSIHRSKGLEFPVVVLADASKRFNEADTRAPVLFHPQVGVGLYRRDDARMIEVSTLTRMAVAGKLTEEMLAEEMRMLYVAMTRARDKLIVTAVPRSVSGTLEALSPAPAVGPVPPQMVADGRSYLDWLCLHVARSGGRHWRVSTVNRPEAPAPQPFAQEADALAAETLRSERTRALAARMAYVYAHTDAVNMPSKLTATALKGRGPDLEIQQNAPPVKRAALFDRPRFMRALGGALTPAEQGTALHLAMQFADFARCRAVETAAEEIERLRRGGFLTPEQAACVDPARIVRFFNSPLGERMMAAERLNRECKFSLLVPAEELTGRGAGEEILLQGVIDCYFEEDGALVVVDFKTDHLRPGEETPRAMEYRPQVQVYARALRAISGRPVRQCLLYFFNTDVAIDVDTLPSEAGL